MASVDGMWFLGFGIILASSQRDRFLGIATAHFLTSAFGIPRRQKSHGALWGSTHGQRRRVASVWGSDFWGMGSRTHPHSRNLGRRFLN